MSELPGRCCAGGGGGDWKGRIKDALPNVRRLPRPLAMKISIKNFG